jgi:hypothetical protein
VLGFIAAVHGGIWERAVALTPTAVVAGFQHGLVRLDVVLIAALLIVAGLALAAIWTRLGVAVRRRTYDSLAVAAIAAVAIFAATFAGASWDTSEARINSFSRADEQALRQIGLPLFIEAHLAPEDPRRTDLERRVVAKLRRVVPHLQVQYVSQTAIGLFEQASEHYGEITYRLNGREVTGRATTPEAALETIYSLAGVTPPPESADDVFRGHPLAVPPRGAAIIFYAVWPAAVAAAAWLERKRRA